MWVPPNGSRRSWRVLRYYRVLILPIALAVAAILARAIILWRSQAHEIKGAAEQDTGRFVLLLGLWWLFDMASSGSVPIRTSSTICR